jgi:hypothetical protein
MVNKEGLADKSTSPLSVFVKESAQDDDLSCA